MQLAEFIQSQILLPRLHQHGALVVYDAEGRYRELCLGLTSEGLVVVDASERVVAHTRVRAISRL